MTAITALITRKCTVHAADSLLTIQRDKNEYIPDDWKFQKIVKVEGELWGAMSFWGFAKAEFDGKEIWNTPNWLAKQAGQLGKQKPEDFANKLAIDLQKELDQFTFLDETGKERPIAKGIGIHFTAYEFIQGFWIPELFLITNWNSLTYTSIDPKKVSASRETYSILERAMNNGVMTTDPRIHGAEQFRLCVHQYLNASESNWLIFNNGDPLMFNNFANGVHNNYQLVSSRGALKDAGSASTYRKLAALPITMIANTQTSLCAENKQLVGGRTHNLSIEPGKCYDSDSGI